PFQRPRQRGLGLQHRGQPRLVPGAGAATGEHAAEQPALSHRGRGGERSVSALTDPARPARRSLHRTWAGRGGGRGSVVVARPSRPTGSPTPIPHTPATPTP